MAHNSPRRQNNRGKNWISASKERAFNLLTDIHEHKGRCILADFLSLPNPRINNSQNQLPCQKFNKGQKLLKPRIHVSCLIEHVIFLAKKDFASKPELPE
jgi:hypothetical protein